MSTSLALQRRITDVIAEYQEKSSLVEAAIGAFEQAGETLKLAATVSGTYGQVSLNTGSIYESNVKESLLRSAWLTIYNGLNIDRIASTKDKKVFEQSMARLPPFTLENIRSTFGDYVANPRGNILRGLAEIFSDLDPIFKSHDKMKIGVKGLPKRVIMRGVSDYGWGRDRLQNVLNALAQVQGKNLVGYGDVSELLKNEEALKESRGVWLKRYDNGNGHLYFSPETLKDINLALAEYYGEVLADCKDDEDLKPQQSTAVSKDLQYYPTPHDVVKRVVEDVYIREGDKVLEPSCGCGRFMDALRRKTSHVFGVEYDPSRVAECRAKGHCVHQANFLEMVPTPIYDYVVMNPPFYGKHYEKHVRHALKFLKPDGVLKAILPATARYDHKLLDDLKGRWENLPVGSFSESGTNINTCILTIHI